MIQTITIEVFETDPEKDAACASMQVPKIVQKPNKIASNFGQTDRHKKCRKIISPGHEVLHG